MSVLDKMLDALTSAYNAKPGGNIGKLFSILADTFDVLGDTFAKIRAWRDVDSAAGTTLDHIGKNFGVDREGMPDTFYRLLIKVKMVSHLRGGDIDTVINAAAELYGLDASRLELTELFPAKLQIALQETDLTAEQIQATPIIATMIKRVMAAGVGFKACLRSESTERISPIYFGMGMIFGGSVTIKPWAYVVPDLRLDHHVGFGLIERGTITIKQGETA